MKELQHWGQRKAEDRIDLTSMDAATTPLTQGSQRIDPSILKKALPQATLKDYQLVGINWLYLLHQVSPHLEERVKMGSTSRISYLTSHLVSLHIHTVEF